MINHLGGAQRFVAVAALILAVGPAHAQSGPAAASVQEQVGTERSAATSQERINKLDAETQRLLDDYRLNLRETESLRRYNQQLELQIQSQEQEMVSIEKQIVEIERTNREIVPLMQRMIETLDQFVQLDLPFLPDERSKRVATLKEMMARADVTTAEKYRRILEAYQVEMEYGRTIEPYQAKIVTEEGEEPITVDILRVGRVALMYQALDGDETGYWDAAAKKWVKDNGYRDAVKEGLKVARKQGAPDILTVPVAAAKKEGA